MAYMQIFPDIELTETELKVVQANLGDPAVRKYFHKLAYDLAKFVVTASQQQGETAEEFLRKRERAQGQMEVLETLLHESFIPFSTNGA